MGKRYLERVALSWSTDSVRLINTPSRKARELFFYVQECGSFKTRQGYFTERAGLDSFLLLYTLSGKGVIKFPDRKQNKEYLLTKGSCFLLDCMEHHYYAVCEGQTGMEEKEYDEREGMEHIDRAGMEHTDRAETGQTGNWEFLWVHFNGISCRGYYEQICPDGFELLTVNNKAAFADEMREVIEYTGRKLISMEARVNSCICDLLSQLITDRLNREQQGSAGAVTYMNDAPDYIRKAMKYIDTSFAEEDIDLTDIAEKVGVSRYHLAREFRRYTGSSIHEYLVLCRLTYAKELLKYSDIPVSEICFSCGMNHVSHFIRIFSDNEKITPLKYRKEWQSI